MPPELIDILGIKIPTMRRDPHYFLPTTGTQLPSDLMVITSASKCRAATSESPVPSPSIPGGRATPCDEGLYQRSGGDAALAGGSCRILGC
jgi:hypothetical protein